MPYKKLLSAVTTTGGSTAYTWFGGRGTFTATGLGGGSVKLQQAADGQTWADVHLPNSTAIVAVTTGDGCLPFQLSGPVSVRALVTTASTTGVTVSVL